MLLPQFATFPANVDTLLATARVHGLTVVHTQAVFQPDGSDWMLFYRAHGRGQIPCVADTDGAQFEDFAAPRLGESIVRKQTFDGFAGTDLEHVLHERGIKAVLIAGLETSVCVLFTATSAYLKRLVPIVVGDACADLAERHEATLRMYTGLCFQQVATAQVQADLSSVVELAGLYADF